MNPEKLPRLSRLVAIVLQLQSRRLITATEIAERFEISTRTVYRDMKALEEAGVPLITEEGRGYTLMEGYKVPPVMFSEPEANALITAEEMISKNKDASLVKNYQEAIMKIKAVMRYGARDKAELLSQRIQFRQNSERDITSDFLSELQLALTNFQIVELHYQALNKEEISIRRVEPFAMYHTNENWILIAWCILRDDFRAFRLDRMRKLRILDERFTPQKMTLQDYFDICRQKNNNYTSNRTE